MQGYEKIKRGNEDKCGYLVLFRINVVILIYMHKGVIFMKVLWKCGDGLCYINHLLRKTIFYGVRSRFLDSSDLNLLMKK